ncbi:ATP-binding cassette domain-containing protein [Brachybacterium huguangmaarense]|uniref:ATP-binding cassette domain-containing protein n=1 Tax=Brachybacterium huguangmaarense TaxID=1652028 RepID=A0ABY6G4H9_9MICO|nr:ATP-binding cassette domain-containing protein [Brachybacterium huguangmaarense]UYG18127.1 ATP-binding cassette domain-containing protein [Brachybacterium huguangmaarense]
MNQIRWLLGFAAPSTGVLAISVLARLCGHAALATALALPAWTVGQMLTGRGTPGTARLALVALAGLVLVVLLGAALRYVEQLTGHLAAFTLLGELRIWVMEGLIPQAPAVTDTRGAARVLDVAVHDVDRIEVFFAHTIAPAVSAVLIPAAAVAVAGGLAGAPAALALAVVLAAGWIVPVLGRRRDRDAAREAGRLRSDLAQHVADSLRLTEVIRGAGTLSARLAGLGALDAALGRVLTAQSHRAGARAGATVLRVWGGTLLVLLVGLATSAPAMPAALPGVLAAAALVPGTASGLDTLERLARSLPAGLAAARRVRELAQAAPEVVEPDAPRALPGAPDRPGTAAAALEHVVFGYPGRSAPVLDDVDLLLDPGATLGVTGPTGSGKSTIARLLQRHRDPGAGRVLVRGVDARELGSGQVRRLVAVADQEPFLQDASVTENLRLAAPFAPDAQLREALARACCELPLDRVVGPRGRP